MKKRKGMTLVELVIAGAIGTILIGMVMGMWVFSQRTWTIEQKKTRSRVDLETALERIKQELRLSSLNYASFYPSGATEHTAITFPMPDPDPNNANFLDLNTDGNIDWNKSVVYYRFGNKLKRTVFANNRTYLMNATDRYDQVSTLAAAATDPQTSMPLSTPNRANAVTSTVIENVSSFTIKPTYQLFDGYSPTEKRSDRVDFGVIRLDPNYALGYHDFKFEIVGTSGAGYGMGLDAISITPSGCEREAEVIALNDSTLLETITGDSGDTASTVYAPGWSGNFYLEYPSDAVGDYINFHLYYDLYRESNFNGATKDNVLLTGDSLYIKLADFQPPLEEGITETWAANAQTGASGQDYNDAIPSPISMANITVRNLVSAANISTNSDLVRIEFTPHSANPVTITKAYLDERDTNVPTKLDAINPPTSATRIQLYFTSGGNVTPGITIPVGPPVYSNWAIFPIDSAKDYLVTFHISSGNVSYWPGPVTLPPTENSYMVYDSGAAYVDNAVLPVPILNQSQPPPPDAFPPDDGDCFSSPDTYVTASMEGWLKAGYIISSIFDTQIADPDYNKIGWTESVPLGSDIMTFAGSSDNSLMSGATWDSASSANPHSLSIGTGRYVQFRANLSTIPFWTCIDHSSTVSVTDALYKAGNYTCPTCGKYLKPACNIPALDNVTIDWPGETTPCLVSAYFTQKSDYGIVKLTVDGREFTKGIDLSLTVFDTFQGRTYDTSITTGVEPRNTGR